MGWTHGISSVVPPVPYGTLTWDGHMGYHGYGWLVLSHVVPTVHLDGMEDMEYHGYL